MNEVEKLMKSLGISKEEAEQIIADDEAIDKGESLDWEPSKEEQKKALKNAHTTSGKKQTRKPREKDENKVKFIEMFANFLKNEGFEEVNITNVQRIVQFKSENEQYEIILQKKRG